MFLDPFPTFQLHGGFLQVSHLLGLAQTCTTLCPGGGTWVEARWELEPCWWEPECSAHKSLAGPGATQRHSGRNSRLTAAATPRPPPQMPTHCVHTKSRWETCDKSPIFLPLPTNQITPFCQLPHAHCVRIVKGWRQSTCCDLNLEQQDFCAGATK